MTHWAMVETLAVFGKGISQVTTRSASSKYYTTTIRYALNVLDEYFKKCASEIRELLTRQQIIAYVLDNFCKVVQNRVQKNTQSAIVH